MNAAAPIAVSAQALRANADLLRHLAAHPEPLLTDLATAIGRDKANLRKTLKTLEEQGLIVSDPEIALTAAGREALASLPAPPADAFADQLRRAAAESEADGEDANAVRALPAEGFVDIHHQLILPDSLNPRSGFDDEALEQLAASIKADGLLQNLVVRPAETMAMFGQPMHRLVAGERRWRAIGLLIRRGDWPEDRRLPCKVVAMDDAGHAVAALLENLQRQDLKPLEEAKAFRRLVDHHGFKTADIADRINATQRMVQQRLQLLELPELQRSMVDEGVLTIEGARKWLAERPKPVALTPRETLVLAEIGRRIVAAMDVRPGVRTRVDWSAAKDATLVGLVQRKLVVRSANYNGEAEVYLTELGVCSLIAAVPDYETDRPGALHRVRMAGADAAGLVRYDGAETFATAWLNKPFARDPEVVKTERERNEQYQAQEKARRIQNETRDRERAEFETKEREAGDALMAALRALETDAPGLSVEAFTGRFRGILTDHIAPGAWSLRRVGNPGEPTLCDGRGDPNVGRGATLEARRRLMAIAINFAAGYEVCSGPPLRDETPDPPDDLDEDEDGDALTDEGGEP